MKTIFFIISLILSASCWGQEMITNNSPYRIQGYLFIRTSLPKNEINSDTTEKRILVDIPIDSPKFYFFKPLKSFSSSSLENLLSIQNQKDEELFLLMGLTETERSIIQTNSDFKFWGIDIELFNQVLKENEFFYKTPKTIIKWKNDELKNAVYEVVYIDGIWTKVFVPYKFKDIVSLGRYSSSQLDPDKKDGYDFYFLKEIKVISYSLNFNDELIIQLK